MTFKLTRAIGLFSLVSQVAIANPKAEPGQYQIDPMHSKVSFEIPHLVISTVEGSFKEFDGSVQLDENFQKSSVKAKVTMASIDTGFGKRDDHLKSADFFDVAKYPLMQFQSTAIKGQPQSFQMVGDLTIRGIKRKVTFEGQYLGAVTDGYGQRKVAFQAKTRINRKDFGLTWNQAVEVGPVVGDEVTIELRVQAARVQPTKQAAN